MLHVNIVQILEQTEVWVARGGIKIPLARMDAEHRRNTLEMLRRRADYQRSMYYLTQEQTYANAPDDVYCVFEQEMAMALDDRAIDWLERRPLVKELMRLVKLDESNSPHIVDGEVVVHAVTTGQRQLEK